MLGLLENPTIEEILRQKEGQFFDRKSARIEPRDLANHIVAFANADGGFIVVGIEDDHKITGLNEYQTKLNAFLQAPWDLCVPSVITEHKFIDCTNNRGQADKVLLFEILQSGKLHANSKDEVYLRLGDKSRKLTFEERMQLAYDRGEVSWDSVPAPEFELAESESAPCTRHDGPGVHARLG